MTRTSTSDLDYLTARLHARRSRMAERARLGELCRARNLPELAHAIFPGAEFPAAADFQRRLVRDLAAEISGCLKHSAAAGQAFVAWLLARFQVENAKILLRGFLNHTPLEAVQPRLAPLPSDLALNAAELMTSKSPEEFVRRLPAGSPRNRLRAVMASWHEPPAFVLEAALDAGYFQELFARNNRLRSSESEVIKPLVLQEANLFQFMLVARGRFHFGLPPEILTPLLVSRRDDGWVNAIWSAPDVLAAAQHVVGIVIDVLPPAGDRSNQSIGVDLSLIETLAWQRYLRLANSAFRRSHIGIGAVAGYFGVRRMEVANLITLSESLRLGLGEMKTRARMLPRTELEVAHV